MYKYWSISLLQRSIPFLLVITLCCLLSCQHKKEHIEHIDIVYSFDNVQVLREMYDSYSRFYQVKEGKRLDGYVELSSYDGWYYGYLIYNRSNDQIELLAYYFFCSEHDVDTSFWSNEATDSIYQKISPWHHNEDYDVAVIHSSLILEIPFNRNKELLGGWTISYPEESIDLDGKGSWIGLVRKPALLFLETEDSDVN